MEQGRLGEAGEGLMEALHRQIRAAPHGALREAPEAQMGPVGLVH